MFKFNITQRILSLTIPAIILSSGGYALDSVEKGAETTNETVVDEVVVDEIIVDEIIVTADFRPGTLQKSAASISVMTADLIKNRSGQHIEDILAVAPNVNFSSGSSRARYFQIRGIGERSQFSQVINPSVGFIIDNVDFSGLGTAATLFDVEQVEVLRGPQGTRYGANALAGVINIRSHSPVDFTEGKIETSISEYGGYGIGVVGNAPLIEGVLSARLAVQQYKSDGFMKNRYLHSDTTNNRDEFTSRLKIRWLANDELTVNFTATHIDIDNGYDAFSLDNNRNTLSDQPGTDAQLTDALAVELHYDLNDILDIEAIYSRADSELEYSYDEDWSYAGISGCQPDYSFCEYSSFDQYLRDRENDTVEIRLISDADGRIFSNSTDWLVGFYYSKKENDLTRNYTYSAGVFLSDYETENSAIYGQLEWPINNIVKIVTGLRFERWEADYVDSNSLKIDHKENLVGGKISIELNLAKEHNTYVTIAKGYKAGGVNTDGSLPVSERDFDTEYLWNVEAGLKSNLLNNKLNTQISVFYTARREQQVKGSYIIVRAGMGPEFIDYVSNAAEGNNYGLEAEFDWQLSSRLQLFGSLGLLKTKVEDYVTPGGFDMDGRDQAHAPNYQYAIGAQYALSQNWYSRVELEGKDTFYFSSRHNEQSDSYRLINARIAYQTKNWDFALWGRNLTDKNYQTRGFGFANDPRNNYSVSGYQQLGEPRIIGFSASYNF